MKWNALIIIGHNRIDWKIALITKNQCKITKSHLKLLTSIKTNWLEWQLKLNSKLTKIDWRCTEIDENSLKIFVVHN